MAKDTTDPSAGTAVDPTGALLALSTALLSHQDMPGVLDAVVHLVRRHIPGADDCSITLIREQRAATVAATGPLPVTVDEIQYQQGYGPCLDAGREDEVQHIADMTTEQRWPRYAPAAAANGVGSSVSLPLPVENYLVGALNVYSRSRHAFGPDSISIGSALAAHVTAALSFAESSHGHRLRADNLARAMSTRDVIEQAKGMIMVAQKCSSQTAFSMLRKLSMDRNIKLTELAASLVASGSAIRFLLRRAAERRSFSTVAPNEWTRAMSGITGPCGAYPIFAADV